MGRLNKNRRECRNFVIPGNKVLLRPMAKKDINDRYLSWINDSEVTRYMETGFFPVTLKELVQYYKRMTRSKTDVLFSIIKKADGTHIGNIKLGGINWIHRFADLGIMIGDKKAWGRGYGTEACDLLLGYAFKKLNLNKIILGVCSPHAAALKAYKKAGFRIEGRLTDMLHLDGSYIDKIIMGMNSREYLRKAKK